MPRACCCCCCSARCRHAADSRDTTTRTVEEGEKKSVDRNECAPHSPCRTKQTSVEFIRAEARRTDSVKDTIVPKLSASINSQTKIKCNETIGSVAKSAHIWYEHTHNNHTHRRLTRAEE